MDLKEEALATCHYLQLLESSHKASEIICNHEVENFNSLCRELGIPEDRIESLKSIVFPPLVGLPWPPMSPTNGSA